MNINNPFEHFYPENLSPREIHTLFVKEFTEYNALTAYKHTFVEGSRGSGKSMILKYLEPSCQIIEQKGWVNFTKKPNAFIGIYINCNTGDYRKREFEELLKINDSSQIMPERIVVHEFIMRIIQWTLKTITDQLSDKLKENKSEIDSIISLLDKNYIYKNKNKYPRTLNCLKNIIDLEREEVNQCVSRYFKESGLPNRKIQYSRNLTEPSLMEGSFLFAFFTKLRKMLNLGNIPFFLLFDEAGYPMLVDTQQKTINTLISQRAHKLVCVKVSYRPESYCADVDLFGKTIQHIHDYDRVNLDGLYTNNSEAYYRRIIEISNKRMKLAGMNVSDIRTFLPEREYEIRQMDKAVKYTSEEYDRLPEVQKIDDKKNYISKYAKARLFQRYFNKAQYWYTGFNNLVHFSAGITRSFLDPCFDMVEKYVQKYPIKQLKTLPSITAEIQWEVIRDFSNDFVEKELKERIRHRDITSIERKYLQYLLNLIDSMGEAFKIRLQNAKSRYPRIISFSIRRSDVENRDLDVVLKKGLEDCFFQKRWYRGKSGYEMLECYILNRRLCPRYGLDLSGFQGRIELTQDIILLAMESTSNFITWFKEKESTGETEAETQLELFNF